MSIPRNTKDNLSRWISAAGASDPANPLLRGVVPPEPVDGRKLPRVLSALCDICRSIFHGEQKVQELGAAVPPHSLGQNVLELEKSAALSGCRLCRLRLQELSEEERAAIDETADITFGFWKGSGTEGVAFGYKTRHNSSADTDSRKNIDKSILLKADAGKNTEVFDVLSGMYTSTNKCALTFELAKTWIKVCETTHVQCRRYMSYSRNMPLPTRLVDVGTNNSEIRLCLGKQITENRRYMTLSHCWGDVTTPKLTRGSVTSFMVKIDIQTLPSTFKDAIAITRELGIRYLWIDKLCIIQDSDEEFEREVSMMDRVYRGSWCNIAAAKAVDDLGGCFTDREVLDVLPCLVETGWDDQPKAVYYCWAPDYWQNNIDTSKLLTRAWVQQERHLSNRLLHFAKDQVFWECLETVACETFPAGLIFGTFTKPSIDPYSFRNDLIKYTDPTMLRYRAWQSIVDKYSGSDLSHPDKDKLFAISGIARRVGPANDYFAGLWWDILPHQLMWSTSTTSHVSRPATYRAPSWSWASIDGPVFTRIPYERADDSILIDIIHAEVTPVGNDRFGPVRDGSIVLQGPLAKVVIRRCTDRYQGKKYWLGNGLSNVFGDLGPFPDGSVVFALTIERNNDDGAMYGITLQPSGHKQGEYVRTGYFAVFNVEPSDPYVAEFTKTLCEPLDPQDYTECAGRHESFGHHQYRISLV